MPYTGPGIQCGVSESFLKEGIISLSSKQRTEGAIFRDQYQRGKAIGPVGTGLEFMGRTCRNKEVPDRLINGRAKAQRNHQTWRIRSYLCLRKRTKKIVMSYNVANGAVINSGPGSDCWVLTLSLPFLTVRPPLGSYLINFNLSFLICYNEDNNSTNLIW